MNALVEQKPALPATSDAAALMDVINRAAMDPAVNVDKMHSLWDLYEKMDSRRAEREFNAALKKAQQEIPAIFKNKKADKNTYADLEQVNDVVVPITTANGLAMSFGNEDSPIEKHYRVVCFLSHDGGHTRKYHADIPADHSGSKNVTQGFGSTVSYGRRYLTMMMFNISTTNEDDDGKRSGGTALAPEKAEELITLINTVGMPMSKFLAWAKVESVADIHPDALGKATNAVKAWAEKNKGAAK